MVVRPLSQMSLEGLTQRLHLVVRSLHYCDTTIICLPNIPCKCPYYQMTDTLYFGKIFRPGSVFHFASLWISRLSNKVYKIWCFSDILTLARYAIRKTWQKVAIHNSSLVLTSTFYKRYHVKFMFLLILLYKRGYLPLTFISIFLSTIGKLKN